MAVFNEIQNLATRSALEMLFSKRKASLEHQIRCVEECTPNLSLEHAADLLAFRLVNPLLLASALAAALHFGEDLFGYLGRYSAGEQLLDIEAKLIRVVHTYFPDSNMAEYAESISAREEELVAVLEALGTEKVGTDGAVKPVAKDDSSTFSTAPCKFNVFWACWLLANPIIEANPFGDKYQSHIAHCYHRLYNDLIHNSRIDCERLETRIDAELNAALASSDFDEQRLDALLKQKEVISKLVIRAVRLYEWDPEEIAAHLAGYEFWLAILPDLDEKTISRDFQRFRPLLPLQDLIHIKHRDGTGTSNSAP